MGGPESPDQVETAGAGRTTATAAHPLGRPVSGGGAVGWSRRTKVALVLGVTALVLVVAALGASAYQAREENHRTTAQLTRTRADLHRTIIELRRSTLALASTRQQDTTTEAHLHGIDAQLATARAQLASDQKNLFIQGISIAAVDTCLGGVEAALNQIAVNDPSGAATSLNQVSSSCQTTESASG